MSEIRFLISFFYFFLFTSVRSSSDIDNNRFLQVPLCDKDTYRNISLEDTFDFNSPRFESSLGYDGDLDCKIVFNGLNGTGVFQITFDLFDLEPSKNCLYYDYVMIFRQGTEESGWDQVSFSTPNTNRLCGMKVRNSIKITISGIRFFINFKTDSRVNGKGFNGTVSYSFPRDYPVIVKIGTDKSLVSTREIKASENGAVNLSCVVSYSEKTEIKWLKEDNTTKLLNELRADMVKNDDKNGSIALEKLILDDEGDYACRASNKYGTTKEKIFLKIVEECSCPKVINVTWYEYPPYTQSIKNFTKKQTPIYKGIFYEILEAMIPVVCGKCPRGHGESTINWDVPNNRLKSLKDVQSDIDNNYDIALPILGGQDQDSQRDRLFVPIIKAPGYLLLEKSVNDGGQKVFSALFACLPLLGITVVMMFCAGIIIWMLEMNWNKDQFPKTFFRGVFQGIWWAYVSMTTVGYGDIAPRGYLGRIFSVIWITTGVIIISILTGAISAGLYVARDIQPTELYDAKVGAIQFSQEYRYAFTHKCKVKDYTDFNSMAEEVKKTGKRDIEGILVDNYVAGYYDELKKLRVNQLVKMEDKRYGILLGGIMNKKEMQQKMLKYLDRQLVKIAAIQSDNVEKKFPANKLFDLMDPTSEMYTTAVLAMGGMLILLILGGLVFDYGYLRPKQREILAANNLDMLESKKVKEMAKSTTITRDEIITELKEQLKYATERIHNLNDLHDQQQTFFLEKKSAFKKEDLEMIIFKRTKKGETQA